jgi:hypothetical protein
MHGERTAGAKIVLQVDHDQGLVSHGGNSS